MRGQSILYDPREMEGVAQTAQPNEISCDLIIYKEEKYKIKL